MLGKSQFLTALLVKDAMKKLGKIALIGLRWSVGMRRRKCHKEKEKRQFPKDVHAVRKNSPPNSSKVNTNPLVQGYFEAS